MKFFLVIFISSLSLNGFAQNISGIWRGSFGDSYFGDMSNSDNYKFEIQIDQRQTEVRGVTYSYHNTDFYAKASLTGKWDKAKKSFLLIEGDIIEVRKMSDVFVCSMTCYLTYSKVGDVEYLIGSFKSVSDVKKTPCGGGRVRLKKMTQSVFRKEPFLVKREALLKEKQKNNLAKNNIKPKPTVNNNTPKPKATVTKPIAKTTITTPKTTAPIVTKPKPIAPPKTTPTKPVDVVIAKPKIADVPPPKEIRARKNEVAETIPLDDENITVNFYDNGEIDGDVISVYLNGNKILSNKTLNYDALTIKLKKSELQNINELVMVAENMGTLPPNTAAMIVYVGSKRYEVQMVSSTTKNASVRFEK